MSPQPNANINQLPPNLAHPSFSCNSNTMDMAYLVKMRQSNKCGSVKNGEIINLHLGFGAGP